jgi:hypothetical protein
MSFSEYGNARVELSSRENVGEGGERISESLKGEIL